jgi:AAA15 family ATPase/GTPase
MNKYDPLYRYLTNIPSDISEKTLTFDEIGEIIKDKLPPSAYKYREWWYPQQQGGRHPCANLWVKAGWKVKNKDISDQWVLFERDIYNKKKTMYKSIKIEGFRQFDNFEINDLGAVNLFLGQNNTGKSSILEAFYTHACGLNFNNFNKKIICGRRFNPPAGAYDAGNQIRSLFYSTESPPYKFDISIIREGKYGRNDRIADINYQYEYIFEPSSSMSSVFDPRAEGYFDASFLENHKESTDTFLGAFKLKDYWKTLPRRDPLSGIFSEMRNRIAIDYKYPNFSINSKYPNFHPAVFHNILDHRYGDKDLVIFSHLKQYDILKDFIAEIKEAFPIIKDIDYIPYLEGAKAPLLITIDKGSKKLPLYVFGDGLRRWYHILGNMITFQNAIHCIEEIDSTFHPESQHKLAPLLLRYSKKYNNQIMLTSHSLEFADAFLSSLYKDKNNELIKEGEDPVRIFTLAKDKNDKLEVWKNTGKEAFELRSKYKMELR